MEPENHESEALRRGLVFPAEIAALKPQIYDDPNSAIRGAVAHHLKRPVAPGDMDKVSTKRVPEIDVDPVEWLLSDADKVKGGEYVLTSALKIT